MAEIVLPEQVCAVVLAGGRASRMGGVDKGLQQIHGIPLAANALKRLRQQAPVAPAQLAVNANRNLADYAQMGVPVWPDTMPDFAGPLAGMLTALEHGAEQFDYLLTVPCDSPYFPLDLLSRLAAGLKAHNADLAMVCAPDPADALQTAASTPLPLHNQPVFLLIKTGLAPHLATFLAQGGRKIGTWCAQHKLHRVPFDRLSDRFAFANVNTLLDLERLDQP